MDPILSLVGVLNEKDPFKLPNKKARSKLDQVRKSFAASYDSDHIMFINAVKKWEKAYSSNTNANFCQKNYLNEKSLEAIFKLKKQLKFRLEKMKILGNFKTLDKNSANFDLINAIIASGLFPSIKQIGHDYKKSFSFLGDGLGKRIYINQRSVNASKIVMQHYMAFFVARGNKKGKLLVQDCSALNKLQATLLTKYQDYHDGRSVVRKEALSYVDKCFLEQIMPSADNKAVDHVLKALKNPNLFN